MRKAKANLVGGSGIPRDSIFGQSSSEAWVLEPNMSTLQHIPQRHEDA